MKRIMKKSICLMLTLCMLFSCILITGTVKPVEAATTSLYTTPNYNKATTINGYTLKYVYSGDTLQGAWKIQKGTGSYRTLVQGNPSGIVSNGNLTYYSVKAEGEPATSTIYCYNYSKKTTSKIKTLKGNSNVVAAYGSKLLYVFYPRDYPQSSRLYAYDTKAKTTRKLDEGIQDLRVGGFNGTSFFYGKANTSTTMPCSVLKQYNLKTSKKTTVTKQLASQGVAGASCYIGSKSVHYAKKVSDHTVKLYKVSLSTGTQTFLKTIKNYRMSRKMTSKSFEYGSTSDKVITVTF